MSHKFPGRRFFAQAALALITSTLLFFPINSASATTITLSDTEFLKFNRANGITNIAGDGTKPGNIVLYKNVGIFGGINIDCAITTVAVNGSISNYDNPGSASTATGYQDNFMLNTVGGEVTLGRSQDAPMCVTCGTKMRPAGSCYVCEGCGSTSGCS